MPPGPGFRFHAYISYAVEDNEPPGRPWADLVQEWLSTFEVPRNVAGRPTPFGPVPARIVVAKPERKKGGEALTEETRAMITQSRAMIVVCSPTAAKSEAVREEVRYFKQLGRDRVIALIIAGEPHAIDPEEECFPETMRYEIKRDGTVDREWRVHPAAADARPEPATQPGERLAQARRTVVGAVLGVPPESLPASRQTGNQPTAGYLLEAKSPSRPSRWIAVVALIACAGLGWYTYRVNEQRLEAEAARKRSDELIATLQRNLREKLAGAGQMSLLAELNQHVVEHFEAAATGGENTVALGALADAYADRAEILLAGGNQAAALETALQAVQARQQLAKLPDAAVETALALVADQRCVAQLLLKMGKPVDAFNVMEQSRALAVSLSGKRLGDVRVERELALAHRTIGDVQMELGKTDEAARAYTQSRELAARLAASSKGDLDLQIEAAASIERLGNVKQRQGDYVGAQVEFADWQQALSELSTANPSNTALKKQLGEACVRLGNLHAFQSRFPEAVAEFRKAGEIFEPLAREQKDDRGLQFSFVTACRRLAETLVQSGPETRTEAMVWFQRALDYLNEKYPGDKDTQAKNVRAEIETVRATAMKKP